MENIDKTLSSLLRRYKSGVHFKAEQFYRERAELGEICFLALVWISFLR